MDSGIVVIDFVSFYCLVQLVGHGSKEKKHRKNSELASLLYHLLGLHRHNHRTDPGSDSILGSRSIGFKFFLLFS